MDIKVGESVYEPREDSELLAYEIRKLKLNPQYILDMGTGTGFQAIIAKQKFPNACVFACDINKAAVECAKYNAKRNKLDIKCFQSNLFEKVPKLKFDLIIFNPPYLPSDDFYDICWSGGYEGIEVILDFFERAKDFLARDGHILFVFSSYSNQEKLKRVLSKLGFNLKVLATQRIFFENIQVGLATPQW